MFKLQLCATPTRQLITLYKQVKDYVSKTCNSLTLCYCIVHVNVVIHVLIVCSLFEWKWTCAGFYCLFIYFLCHKRSSYQEKRIGIPLTSLTPPHFCACPMPGSGFPTSYAIAPPPFFVCSELRWEILLILVKLLTINI